MPTNNVNQIAALLRNCNAGEISDVMALLAGTIEGRTEMGELFEAEYSGGAIRPYVSTHAVKLLRNCLASIPASYTRDYLGTLSAEHEIAFLLHSHSAFKLGSKRNVHAFLTMVRTKGMAAIPGTQYQVAYSHTSAAHYYRLQLRGIDD